MITESRVKGLVDHFCAEQGVKNYTIKFSKAKTTLGKCSYIRPVYDLYGQYDYKRSTVLFTFSTFWMEHSDLETLIDVILHEIAHSIAGPRAKHGYEWKKVARRLGCNPKATTNSTITRDVREKTAKWIGVCPNGHKVIRNRLTENVRLRHSCSSCSSVYDPRYRFVWQKNLARA